MEKYVRITFHMERDSEVIGKVETDLSGRLLEDSVYVTDEWMRKFFGKCDSAYWAIESVEEITKEEAMNCQCDVDIDVFQVEAKQEDSEEGKEN
jgi:hypothetical protein